jgi:hypothetical protein
MFCYRKAALLITCTLLFCLTGEAGAETIHLLCDGRQTVHRVELSSGKDQDFDRQPDHSEWTVDYSAQTVNGKPATITTDWVEFTAGFSAPDRFEFMGSLEPVNNDDWKINRYTGKYFRDWEGLRNYGAEMGKFTIWSEGVCRPAKPGKRQF